MNLVATQERLESDVSGGKPTTRYTQNPATICNFPAGPGIISNDNLGGVATYDALADVKYYDRPILHWYLMQQPLLKEDSLTLALTPFPAQKNLVLDL